MLITDAVPAKPDNFMLLPNTWPCSLSIVWVFPEGIVSLNIQLPPLPVVPVVAVAILQSVISTLSDLIVTGKHKLLISYKAMY